MRSLSRVISGRAAWAMLAAVVVLALVFGSVHPGAEGAAARIAHLDSVIKCPSCEDLSIAQSNAPVAVGLREVVAADVRAGQSDAEVEQYVVSRYGQSILLEPAGGIGAVVWILPLAVLAVAATAVVATLWRRRGPVAGVAGERHGVDRGDLRTADEGATAVVPGAASASVPGDARAPRLAARGEAGDPSEDEALVAAALGRSPTSDGPRC